MLEHFTCVPSIEVTLKKPSTKIAVLTAFTLICASCAGIPYPTDFHLYDDLRSFKAKPMQQLAGNSYRLVWHAWHQTPGLITANCFKEECSLEVRHTDGYGTYQQGKLVGRGKVNISRHEFEVVAGGFNKNRFRELSPNLRQNSRYAGLASENDNSEAIKICLHAPHYYLESNVEGEYHVIYRYCQDDYGRDLEVAFPLIELAEKYFPSQMQHITAVWIQEERSQ